MPNYRLYIEVNQTNYNTEQHATSETEAISEAKQYYSEELETNPDGIKILAITKI